MPAKIGFKENEHILLSLAQKEPKDKFLDGIWIPVDIQVYAGKFHGKTDDELSKRSILLFINELEILYDKLVGHARISSFEGKVDVKIVGDGLGHIKLDFMIEGEIARLQFETEMDQTFLPKLIKELRSMLDGTP